MTKIKDFVTLPNGGKLFLLPISQADLQGITLTVEKEFREQGEPVDIPTYTTDVDEVIEWDEASMEKDGTDEEKGNWAAYLQALEDMSQERVKRIAYFVLTESPRLYRTKKGNEVDLIIDELEPEFEPPPNWLKRQAKMGGYVLPDDPYDRKYDFVGSLITAADLIFQIIAKATSLAMKGAVTDEGVAKVEATFLGKMAKAQRKEETGILSRLEEFDGMVEEKE